MLIARLFMLRVNYGTHTSTEYFNLFDRDLIIFFVYVNCVVNYGTHSKLC